MGEMDDAAIARLMQDQEQAAADAAGVDYSPQIARKKKRTSDDNYAPAGEAKRNKISRKPQVRSDVARA
jgi:hypothetical protein